MKRNGIRLLAMMLCAAMLLGMAPCVTVSAAEEELPKLGTPADLRWGYKTITRKDEETGEYVGFPNESDCPTDIAWKTTLPYQGKYTLTLYRCDGSRDEWVRNELATLGSEDYETYLYDDTFISYEDLESGTYYFTVQARGDGTQYADSEVAVSDTWTYVKPDEKLGDCTNLTWDWPEMHWELPEGANRVMYEVFFAASAEEEPQSFSSGRYNNAKTTGEIYDNQIQRFGDGYYSFRVRAISENLEEIYHGDWSELCVYHLDSDGVKTQLDSLVADSDSMTDEEIRDSVQSMDTAALESAMLADQDNTGAVADIAALEEKVGGPATVEVSEEAPDFDAEKVTIVGANLNNSNSEEPITLIIDKAEEEHVFGGYYSNSVAVSFSMDLENVEDSQNLEVPVKITMPVPDSIDPEYLVIMHIHADGNQELIEPYVYSEDGEYYASFVLTSFSDFVMTQPEDTVSCDEHTPETIPGKAATCTEDGLTEGKKCSVCGEVIEEQTAIPALGHTEVVDEAVAATCTATGLTEGSHCSVCNTVIKAQESVPMTDHTWDEGTVTLEPTEEAAGVKTYTCTVCGEKKEETIPALEHTHSYTDEVTAPTCTEQGYTTHTCACGDSYVDTYVDALGHTEVTDAAVAATCTATGLTEGSHCSVCGQILVAQQEIPMVEHTWDEGVVTKEPTSEEAGVKTYTCTVCGEKKEETIPALEHTHSYTDEVTAPTCTEQGYTTHTCACGDSYVDTYVDALGHTEVTDAAVAATCTATGLTEGSHCSVCNTVIKAQESVPMVEHTWDEGVVTKEPTSEEAGVKTYTCTVCGETKTEDIPVTAPAVTRVYGDDRYATAFAIADTMKEVMGIEQFNAVVISNSENFPDALAGSYLAAMADAPILLTKDKASRLNPVKEYISENLVSGGKVYILGSEGVVPASLENDLTNAGYDVERLAGSDRYETNLAVLRVAMALDPDKTKPILVSTGRAFADSLSVSASGLPLLLVRGDKTLTDTQKAFLEENADRARYVIGSNGVVYDSMYEAVGATKRIAGADRYETSVAVANELVSNAGAVVLAYASDFPDGLCGGPLAYQMGASLILTKVRHEDVAANYVAENGIPGGYVLGSDSLVTDAVVNSIFNID